MKKILLALTAVIAIVIAVPGAAFAADTTVVVTPSALSGWTVQPDGTVPHAFTGGTASLGAGSLGFGPIDGANGANKFVLYAPYNGLTSDLTQFSYDFNVDPSSPGGAADGQHFYANVYVDDSTNGIGTFASGGWYDCRYDSVPAAGAVDGWTTHSFTQTSSWTNVADRSGNCGTTLEALASGSKVKFIALNGGQSTTSDAGLKGAYDKVVVTTPSSKTTYDFEPQIAGCATNVADAAKTITLLANCTVTNTVTVPSGYTLDGNGKTITVVDPVGGAFAGAVVENGGDTMHVKDLKIDSTGANNCVAVFNGVAFMHASGSIKNVTLNNIGRQTGCQSGRAILVNAIGDTTKRSVTIEGNTVTSYNKNGIDVRGNVDARIVGNTVTGRGPISYIAQNGIVVIGASALIDGNVVSGNSYLPTDVVSYGILVIDATGVKKKQNALSGNEADFGNFGRGGGKTSA